MSVTAPYKMPAISVGQTVMWSHEPGTMHKSEPGIVTMVGSGSICVTVWPPGSRVGVVKSGVRHMHDPNLRNVISHEGVWDYTERDKTLNTILE